MESRCPARITIVDLGTALPCRNFSKTHMCRAKDFRGSPSGGENRQFGTRRNGQGHIKTESATLEVLTGLLLKDLNSWQTLNRMVLTGGGKR